MFSILLLANAAHAQVVDFACNGEPRVVGVPPVVVDCAAVVTAPGDWVDIVWRLGDGTVATGPTVRHEYEQTGAYSVSVTLEGYEPAREDGLQVSVRRDDAVTVCGPPEPEFDYVLKGGRDYQLVNRTAVDTPQCLDTIAWRVMRGNGNDGAPLFAFDTWEPRFELPEDGTYTVTLTATGLAGAASASARIEADYGLTDDYYAHHSTTCASAPTGVVAWLLLPLALVLRRRR